MKKASRAGGEETRKSGRKGQEKEELKLRVLILEDNPADAELMERQLRKAGIGIVPRRADARSGFLRGLKAFKPDLILADYKLPTFNALQALDLRNTTAPFTPFIIVTGSISEEIAVECMKHGADDYLLKDRLARLAEAVKHALETRRLQSEKAEAAETLRKSEENFADIFQTVREGIAYTTLLGKVIAINPALEQILEIPREDIVGENILNLTKKLLSKENIQRTIPHLKKLIREKVSSGFQVEYKDRLLEIHATVNRETRRLTGVVRDITERQRYDTALQAAATRWRTTFDSMNDAVCLLDEKGAVLQCNRAMNRLLGTPYTQIIGKDCLSLVCGTRKKPTCSFHLLLKDRKRHEEETFWRERWFHVQADPIIGSAGQLIGAVHIMTDISREKKVEKELRDSEAYFRLLFENSVVGFSQALPDGRLIRVNRAYARMYGYANPEEMIAEVTDIGRQLYVDPNDRKRVLAILKEKGVMEPAEMRVRHRDGSPFVVLAGAREIRDGNGRLVCYQAEHVDMTLLKRTEESLHEMSEIFRLFLKHNPIYVFIKDENIRPIYLSENYEKMLARPLAELLGKSMDELFPSALSRTMVEDDKKILREGKPREFIEELEGRTYSTLKFPIFIQGKARYLAGYTTDITERQKAQELLQALSRRLQLALQSAQAGTWDWNVATGHIEWSPQMFALFGLDPRSDAASFESWRTALHPEDRELAGSRIDQALKKHATLDSDYRIVWPDGQIRWINAMGVGVYDQAGHPIQMVGVCQDISERKQAEERLQASLLEKEILLKEIHHRVKNNLQIVSGLLTLQSAQISDTQLQRVIRDSQSRIWTMALIHQTLYQSGNMAAIDMADYIHTLTGNLLSAHVRVAMPPTLSFDLQPLRLAIDKAIPLALIINELVTNAMKHAFKDGRSGEIRITLQEHRAPAAEAAPAYELTVSDDGIGLPAGFDLQNQKSLGLQLVTMLAKQLEGSLAIASQGGTAMTITFKIHEKNDKGS